MTRRAVRVRRWGAAIISVALAALTGCTGFFPPVKNGGGGDGGGGGPTGNYVYVANASQGSVSGFSIGTGKLTRVANSPLNLGYSPVALAVTPSNNFLYIAGPLSINVYAINANGSLTVPSGGATAPIATVVSLDVSPDGKWLFGLDGIQQLLDIYQINTTNGGLALAGTAPYPIVSGEWVPRMVRVAPSGAFVFATLGTAGDAVFTFNTTTGATIHVQHLDLNTGTSDNAVAIDGNTAYLYIARSGVGPGVAVYSIGTNGKLNAVNGSPFAAGTQTFSVVLNKSGTDVYAGNRHDSTISGYSIGALSALTPLTGSPYTSGLQVTALGVDSTGKYLLAAANGGSPDLTMYSFDATIPGKLDTVTNTSTDTAPSNPVAIALTH